MDHYQYNPEVNSNGNNEINNTGNYKKNTDNLGLASLIFGILAVPALLTLWFGVIFAVAAIVLAILSRLNNGKFEGKAAAGLTIGIIILVIALMIFIAFLQLVSNPESVRQLIDYMREYTNSIQ